MERWECRVCDNYEYTEENGLFYCTKCGITYKFIEQLRCSLNRCIYNDGEYCTSKKEFKTGCYVSRGY